MKVYKVIIAGSRDWTDEKVMKEYLEKFWLKFCSKTDKQIVISGTARGADSMGEEMAKAHGLDIIYMPANWTAYGKRAGYIRNKEMAKMADGCIVFWNGNSHGSLDMWNLALQHDLDAMLVRRTEVEPVIEEIVIPRGHTPGS
jgi:hypothetical protein